MITFCSVPPFEIWNIGGWPSVWPPPPSEPDPVKRFMPPS